MLKCNTCGGEYKKICLDGMTYFHSCPPIVDQDNVMSERPDKRDENVGKKLQGKGADVIES